jgi:hypothetical protein
MIEFKQGQDPYTTMKLGHNRPYAEGDKLICIRDKHPFAPGDLTHISYITKFGNVSHNVLQLSDSFNLCLDQANFHWFFKRI